MTINPSTLSSSASESSLSPPPQGRPTDETPSGFLAPPPYKQDLEGHWLQMDKDLAIGLDDPSEVAPYRGPEWYLVPIIFGAIFIVGALGNGCLIYTVLRYKEMRTPPSYLLVSLATGDLLLILISVPFSGTIYTFETWPYGEFACKLNEFLVAFSLGVTVFTLIALSYERYSVIVHPIQAGKRRSEGRGRRGRPSFKTMTVVAVVWVLAVGLATVELFAAHVSYGWLRIMIITTTTNCY